MQYRSAVRVLVYKRFSSLKVFVYVSNTRVEHIIHRKILPLTLHDFTSFFTCSGKSRTAFQGFYCLLHWMPLIMEEIRKRRRRKKKRFPLTQALCCRATFFFLTLFTSAISLRLLHNELKAINKAHQHKHRV